MRHGCWRIPWNGGSKGVRLSVVQGRGCNRTARPAVAPYQNPERLVREDGEEVFEGGAIGGGADGERVVVAAVEFDELFGFVGGGEQAL